MRTFQPTSVLHCFLWKLFANAFLMQYFFWHNCEHRIFSVVDNFNDFDLIAFYLFDANLFDRENNILKKMNFLAKGTKEIDKSKKILTDN